MDPAARFAVPRTAMRRLNARLLDPDTAVQVPGSPHLQRTVYIADTLLVTASGFGRGSRVLEELAGVAKELGLEMVQEERNWDRLLDDALDSPSLLGGAVRFVQVEAGPAVDVWKVLVKLREEHPESGRSVQLSHVLLNATGYADGVTGYADGVTGYADGVTGYADGVGGYADGVGDGAAGPWGSGMTRWPVVWSAPDPQPEDASPDGPVVAIVDTGLGKHRWFPDGPMVVRDVRVGGRQVGLRFSADQDPEGSGVTINLISGLLDRVAGHGTFIAGIVRQRCPEAVIWSVPVMAGDGAASEHDLIEALKGLALAHITGQRITAINISSGYYHETVGAFEDETALTDVLKLLARLGVQVVAAAGNSATNRPFYPAGFAAGIEGLWSVGAQNPDSAAVSAFSNTGDWVSEYRPGTFIISTIPTTFNGSLRGGLESYPPGLPARATVDPDSFASGFASWSGTSFAAPVVAAEIAAHGHPVRAS